MTDTKHRSKGEGIVYWNEKRGRYIGKVTVDKTVHRVSVTPTGDTQKAKAAAETEAKRRLRKVISDIEKGAAPGDGNMTVGQLMGRWVTKVRPAMDRPITEAGMRTNRWAAGVVTEVLGTKRLRTLTPEAIEAAFETLATTPERGKKKQGMSRNSLVKARSVLGQALAYAQRRNLINHNPAREVVLPSEARKAARGQSLTDDQFRKFLTALAGHPMQALFATMGMLGLRPGEALGLHWDAIDLDAGVVHVVRSLKLQNGLPVIDHNLKTVKARRSLDMPNRLVELFIEHRDRQIDLEHKHLAVWSLDWPGLVFTTAMGTPLNPSNVRRSLTKELKRAGLDDMRVYDMRHTAFSIMAHRGLSLDSIADVAGHTDTRMVERVYKHRIAPTVSGARVAMDEVFK